MSDEGDKTCPLCAEEMDLTDQQLKPCKCGYEICVWCWHHIMDMAEKDETEGRCPACRTPYNKEKIVGTAPSCERLVSEMNVEKKKSHKVKGKTSEGRKQLASVRVIQKNLVYVVGLPLNFADEDLLQHKEYFGQYGKVLKVSISRTANGAIQYSANSTCSVYITYSKEEEAVRCIQSVHGFVLDGRSLRACFGTTKYCHAWLRNVPCSNPDCLYLHEIGSQEDSFTKDEIISAYTRVQRITGSSNSTQRRSGNVLPPPVDEYCNNTASSGKPIAKNTVNTNNSAVSTRVSPPNSSSGRSAALPAGASWGTRASNNQSVIGSVQCSNGPPKQKPIVCNGPVACSTAAESPTIISSSQSDTQKTMVPNEEQSISQDKSRTENPDPVEKSGTDKKFTVLESSTSVHSLTLPINIQQHGSPSSHLPSNSEDIVDSSVMSSGLASDSDSIEAPSRNMENICSDILSMDISVRKILENRNGKDMRESVSSQISGTTVHTRGEGGLTYAGSDCKLGMETKVIRKDVLEEENDLWSFDKQRLKDPEITSIMKPDISLSSPLSNHSYMHSLPFCNADSSVRTTLDRQVADINSKFVVSNSTFPSGDTGALVNNLEAKDVEYSNLKKERPSAGRYEGEPANGTFDIGESSIISNILSMDFDPWGEAITSPQNLSKLIGKPDKHPGGFGVPGSLKVQNSNQSRFSFAREEEPKSQVSDHGQFIDIFERGFMQHALGNDLSSRNGLQLDRFVSRSEFPPVNSSESAIFAGSHSDIPSNRFTVSRSQISAPPGFSVPSRAPPPGFSSHERMDHNLDALSGNHLLDVSSLSNHYQTPPSLGGNNTISNGDIEFIDPAILAVGKGMLPGSINSPGAEFRSGYSPQLNTYEEARFRSFLQRSLPPQQNQRFTDMGDGYSPLGDAYGIPSRFLEQKLVNNLSPISQFTFPQSRNGLTSHGQLDGWSEIQSGGNIGMGELLRTERLGLNKFYGGYEESKIRTPSSGNLYNGTYGI